MPLRMSDVSNISGATRDTINKWIERGVLETEIPTTSAGVAREFTRENAVEIAFLAALVNGGIDPTSAKGFVATWMAQELEGDLKRYFYFNPRHLAESRTAFFSFDSDEAWAQPGGRLSDQLEGRLVSDDSEASAFDDSEQWFAATLVRIDRRALVWRIDSAVNSAN